MKKVAKVTKPSYAPRKLGASKGKPKSYDPTKIESKWQKKWQSSKIYKTKEDNKKPKYYVLDMFPYPSGEGLHVGHPKGYIATDIISRYKRMTGHSVLHPMGFDAFGLPAENYALKTKTNPSDSVKKNVARYKKQLEILGFDYDWAREVNTTDPKYYKWTQWIFLKLLEKGLAYESYEPINWCPSCKTGLANEDVEDGKCERCGAVVEKKPMRQWVLKITDYAERLLADLDTVQKEKTPLFVNNKGEDAVRNDLPFVERNVVMCVVKHWKEDKFLCLKWKKLSWNGFVLGGIENGETASKTSIREIAEETGYTNVRFIRELGQVDSKFFQSVKNVNRFAHFTVVYLELVDGQQNETKQEEKDLHDVMWVDKNEVVNFLNRDDLKYAWELFIGKKKQESKLLLDWPESIKILQKNWIGKSEGVNFRQKIKDLNISFEVYDSIPQTFLAQTFTVIAPEHKLVSELVKGTEREKEVMEFVQRIIDKKRTNKFDVEKDMEGIFTGRYVENPFGTGDFPIWIASYVLADYGTGIVNCSAHDERDFAFAKKYNIPLKIALLPEDKDHAEKVKSLEVFYRELNGIIQEPRECAGLKWIESREKIIDYIIAKGYGHRTVNYKLRDWVFSRQRYWGEPIPVIHCENCKLVRPEFNGIVPVPEKDLPVILPKVKSYEPTGTGESPLAAIAKWVNVKCPVCKSPAKRETNTMPQWAGSSWYYLRYLDPKNNKVLASKKTLDYWCGDKDDGVDLYVGGAEHATRHLIYARFWHKFLYDIGVVSNIEPFLKLQHVGLIMGEDGRKMSKRFGNVINPDEIVKNYGADSLRLYEMFMGPFDQQIAWSTNSISGVRRFIEKVWRLREKVVVSENVEFVDKIIHKTIKKVTEDIENMRYNTAISSMMIAINEIEKAESITRGQYENILKLLAPFAPHFTEELWGSLGNKKSIHIGDWPQFDSALIVDDEVNIMVQVNGKVRGSFTSPAGADNASLEAKAKEVDEVKKWLDGKRVVKVIVVPKRLVNIVVA